MENYHKEQHCSFCGRGASEVETIISGPNGINICNECIDECVYMLGKKDQKTANDGISLYTPKEIKAKLDENGVEYVSRTYVGIHSYSVWKNALYDFVQELFKQEI